MFDLLGFLLPVLLTAKLLLQEMWVCGVSWDTPLPENIKSKFLKWYNRLEVLSELRIPWRMGVGDRSFWSLHVFCDTSQHAYATIIFLRCETNEENLSVLW
ncbi:integrase catalytic domain-containing protein [Trichonephila clavata]|uniref:Integrase catalytic domain-containing protein n=1 Tax=Trichonephila clavata TaxID=2740835 RepID=A0A8X6M2M5_TRICU|nr:integrase catalytic domain-containing protein [Trichonephila clavata]